MKIKPRTLVGNKRLTDYPLLREAVINYSSVMKVKKIKFKMRRGFDKSLMSYMS